MHTQLVSGSIVAAVQADHGVHEMRPAPGHRLLLGPATMQIDAAGHTTLRTVRRGRLAIDVGGRRTRLDEDTFIVLPAAMPFAPAAAATADAAAAHAALLTVVFETGAGVGASDDGDAHGDGAGLWPTVRLRDGDVGAALRDLERRRLAAAPPDDAVAALAHALAQRRRDERAAAARMPAVKEATRRELLRRVLLAAEFIHARYEQPIGLADIAAAAQLSRFYLVRLFERVHGTTPHALLTRRRVAAAGRLLREGRLGVDEVAERCGLGTRWSLFRHVRRELGLAPAALRAAGAAAA